MLLFSVLVVFVCELHFHRGLAVLGRVEIFRVQLRSDLLQSQMTADITLLRMQLKLSVHDRVTRIIILADLTVANHLLAIVH